MTDKEAQHQIYCGPCTCGYLEETIDSLRAELRRQSQELETMRAVVEAARVVAAGWLNGRTISGERDSMNKLIAALARTEKKP